MDKKLLGIYINDHLAGHVAGLELTKRSAASNEGTPLGDYLEQFVAELEEEKVTIERALEEVDADPSRVKTMGAWVAEKAGRLKLNGNVTGYSPLSRLLEIETMSNGVASKMDLWSALQRMQVGSDAEYQGLLDRAERQKAQLETFSHSAITTAFAGEPQEATG